MEQQYIDMGRRIRLRRIELNIKQSQLAENIGISNNHMSSIERAKEKPSLDTFVKICEILNVTPDYLLMGSLHPSNIPEDIADKLKLCNESDISLARNIVELLVERNQTQK